MNKFLTLVMLLCLGFPSLSFAQTTILDFDATTTTFGGFGGVNSNGVIPDPGNPANNVLEICKEDPSEVWGGVFSESLPVNIDLTSGLTEICVDVFQPTATGTFLLKLEGSATAGNWELLLPTVMGWNTLCFDTSQPSSAGDGVIAMGHLYTVLTMFPDFGTCCTNQCYLIDNVIVNPILCELSVAAGTVSCDAVTSGVDTYTATFPFSQLSVPGAGTFTVTTASGGTVGGDDPNTELSGTVTISGIPEGTDADITISDGAFCNEMAMIASPTCAPSYTVTFVVDLCEQIIAGTFDPATQAVFVTGGNANQTGNYNDCGAAMIDADGDGVYEISQSYPEGYVIAYKFLIGDIAWANTGACTGAGFEPNLVPCGVGQFQDREHTVTSDIVLDNVCFGSCDACTACPSCPTAPPFCNFPYEAGKCMYLLQLEDSAGNGWDGASLSVSVAEEWPAIDYKMTVADGKCKYIPIYVNDGETIDFTYWNGANESEHGWTLYTPIESIATANDGTVLSFDGNTPSNVTHRVKAECIDVACEGETLDLVLQIDFQAGIIYNPEELFWEIRDMNGDIVYGENPGEYSSQTSGTTETIDVTLNKCETYTFVAGDAGGDFDFWHANIFTFLVEDGLGYGTPLPGPYDIFVSDQPQASGNSVSGMRMYDLTIPCHPTIAAQDVRLLINDGGADGTDNVANGTCSLAEDDIVLPIAAPVICGAGKCHVSCATPAVTMDVMIDGTVVGTYNFDLPNDYTGGNFVDANGDGVPEGIIVDLSAGIDVGTHNLTYKATYNCEVFEDLVMAMSSIDLIVTSESNPTLSCNDLVHVSLNEGIDDCKVIITPDMVLEDISNCDGDYIVEVVETGGNYIDASFCGQTLTYKITHIYSDNICWGTLLVEDKQAPILTCVDFDASCLHPNATDLPAYTEFDEFCTEEELAIKGVDITPFGGAAQASIAGANYAGNLPTEAELIAGASYTSGATGYAAFGFSQTTFATVGCTPIGEVVKDLSVTVNIDHTDVEDLAVVLLPPAAVQAVLANTINRGGYNNHPFITLMDFGTCATGNEQSTDMEVTFDLGVGIPPIGSDCGNNPAIEGTYTPADIGGFAALSTLLYTDMAGDWTIALYDDDDNRYLLDIGNQFVNVGYGNLDDACLNITHGFPEPYTVFDCTLEDVELLDEMYVETNCNQGDWNGAQVVRVWQATDEKGNASTCTQTINLRAPTLDQIELPGDAQFECGELSDENNPAPIESGIPRFDCFDLAGDDIHSLCDVTYSYEDVVLPTCGNGKKIIRTWTIVNWCSGVNKPHEQIIKIEDTTGPNIDEDEIQFVGTDAYDCSASVDLSAAITDACSGVASTTATYILGGGPYDPNGTLVIVDVFNGELLEDLPFGPTEVIIAAKDSCLNESLLTVTIDIVDDTAPVAICDDQLNLSLGSDGTVRVYAEDFDEGSYDNCGNITLEISKNGNNYGEYVELDCGDAGIETLYLLVTDENGNENTCWAEVLIEDALPPVITCPADKTLTCDDDAVHDPFGEAEAFDNCDVDVDFVDSGELDQCRAGTLTRTWTATDGSDKSPDVSCSQEITVEHVSDFVVQFPADVTLTNCAEQDAGAPSISDDDCELLAISADTLVLDIVDDACYKLEITWTVINWCIYDQDNPNNTDLGEPQPLPRTFQDDDGYFQYTQIVKILDNDAPVIDCPDDLTFCDLTDACEGQADLTISATDACSPDDALEYNYKIDAFNDGTFDIVDNGNDASGVYPYGTHRIKWIVEDGCGNTSSCEYLFTVEDCKNPTPVCLNGITIENMQTGCVDIWASDLLEYAFDNCSDAAYVEGSVKMRREGAISSPQTAMTLCCEDLGTVIVEIWVEDEAGNADYCTTYIIVQDNLGGCDTGTDPGDDSRPVAGTIRNNNGDNVEMVTMNLTGGMADGYDTGSNGSYMFPEVPMHNDYTLTPSKDMNPINGVSTYDLVLIGQHILGQAPLTDPYKMIAADINNDGNISTFDVVQLRQLILFIVSDFVDNSSWRFVDASYVFPNAQNPWMEAFPEVININDLSQDELTNDFIAVKIGDVDGNAAANNLLGAQERNATGSLNFKIEDAKTTKGQAYTVDFLASDFTTINGFQYTLNFDAAAMTFVSVEAGALNVKEANFGLTMLNEGVITTSWNSTATTVANDEVLFSMTFNANASANLSDVLSVTSRYTNAEAYNATQLLDVALAFNTAEGTITAGGVFELYQNTPNPFNGETVIGFNLPTASKASIKIYDVSGRTLKVVEGDFNRGYNQIEVAGEELETSGILYYQLDTANDSATRKMIKLK